MFNDSWSTFNNFLTSEKIETWQLLKRIIKPLASEGWRNFKNKNTVELKDYIHFTEYRGNKNSMDTLLRSNLPEDYNNNKTFFRYKIEIWSVIKLQNKAEEILKENISWVMKNIKLNDLKGKVYKLLKRIRYCNR